VSSWAVQEGVACAHAADAPPSPGPAEACEDCLRVGGRWVVLMGPYGVRGEYLQLDRPRLLQFSWSFDHEADAAPSLVTVELAETSTGTALVLTHNKFADADDRGGNAEGWSLCLHRLESLLG